MKLSIKSVFKAPEYSVMVGLGEATVVYQIYQHAVPNQTDIRAANPHDVDVEGARRRAAWMSAVFLGLVFAITQDRNSLVIGAAALGGIDLMVKHANAVVPGTGRMAETQPAPGGTVDNETAFPLPDYADDSDADGGY